MQKLLLYLFALICCVNAKAQSSLSSQLEQAKFDIIKKTVEFLSTDTTTFKKVTSNTCGDCKSFNDLKKFAAANNLTNADVYVIDPLSKIVIDTSVNKWSVSLNNFKKQVPEKITGAGKEKRKNLSGYKEYLASLNTIVEGVKPGEPKPVPTSEAQPAVAAAPVKRTADTTAIFKEETQPATGLLSISSPWLAYAIAALSIGLLVYTTLKSNKIKRRKEYYKEKNHRLKTEVEQHKETILLLSGKKEQLEKELSESELDRQFLEDRLKLAEQEKKQAPADQLIEVPAINATAQKSNKSPQVQAPRPPVANIKYAKYADMGDGFSNSELVEKPDSETIFEVTIASNNTGEFKIIDNPDAQKYALSNAQYFLGKTCQYDSFPSENAKIKTNTPGTLRLNGGKWTITNPAKITFS